MRVSKSEKVHIESVLMAGRKESVAAVLRSHAIESFREYFCVSRFASKYAAFYVHYEPPRLLEGQVDGPTTRRLKSVGVEGVLKRSIASAKMKSSFPERSKGG